MRLRASSLGGLERATGGDYRLFEPCSIVFALANKPKSKAKAGLGLRPLEWLALAIEFLQGLTKHDDRLFEPDGPTLVDRERHEHHAEAQLAQGPARGRVRASVPPRPPKGCERLFFE